MGDIPRYPPFTEGLPAASPKALLDTQESLVRQLKHELALTPEQEKTLVDPLLISYASFVHLLPASKGHHHRGAGGMLRHGLEVALWASRGFHGRIIDGQETGERRKILEPRWRLAVAVAGLCHDLGKTAYDVVVTDETGKKTWDVYGSLLSDWIVKEDLDRYFLYWRSGREHKVHERFGHLLTMRVIPHQVLSYLNEADPRIIAVMHETIAGQIPKGAAKVVHELVMAADQRSVQRDIKGQRVAGSDSAVGVPVAKYLVDSMKRLIEQGKWKANQEGQPLWVTGAGVYLDWDQAVPQMIELLLEDGISGIPRSHNSVAESLSDFDVIQRQVNPDGVETFYISIAPEKMCSKKKVHKFRAVELAGLDILFDGPHPAPVDVHVGEGAITAREELNEKRDKKLANERNDRALKRHEEKVDKPDGQSRPVMPSESDSDEAGEPESTEDTPQEELSYPEPEPADLEALAKAKGGPKAQIGVPDKKPASWLDSLPLEQREVVERCLIPGLCEHAREHDGEIIARYPEALEGFGKARNEKLELIKPLLAQHPTVPGKPTQKRKLGKKEVNVLVVSEEVAKSISALIPSEVAPAKKAEPTAKPAPAKKAKKPKAQAPPKQSPATQAPPSAQTPPASSPAPSEQKPEQEPAPAQAPPKAAAKQKAQSPAKPDGKKKKPPSQSPPKMKANENPMLVQIREKVLAEYPEEKIEGASGGYWVSASDSAQWYVKNVRPDLSLGPVMAALYQLKGSTDQLPPNDDQDFVLVK